MRCFTDDVTGIPAEHPNAPKNMGLSSTQMDELVAATNTFFQTAITALAAQGKYIWQGFGAQDGVSGGPSHSSCAAYMANVCAPAWQSVPWTVQWDGTNTTMAAFLIGACRDAVLSHLCVIAVSMKSANCCVFC